MKNLWIATPKDTRYIPLTQQAACCVPTCIQMVMYKNNITLVPAEEIGYHLGLVVHPDRAHLFYKARTAIKAPPVGYGTQIYLPEYEPNAAFKKLGVPLVFSNISISELNSGSDLLSQLEKIETADGDALLCFNHGALIDDELKNWGHVCVFDRIIDGKIRVVDPSPEHPKWRRVDAKKMFEAMKKHGVKKSAGIWLLSKV